MRGDKHDVFEPTDGSAPKYAGQYKVNPIAMLLTTKLMFDWLSETERATRLDRRCPRDQGRQSPHLRHGRSRFQLDVAKAIADYAI